jgi:multiple sugar transport system substrate-binding protein
MNRRYGGWSVLAIVVAVSLAAGACAPAPAEDPAAPAVTRVNLWHTIPIETEVYFVNELLPTFVAAHPECVIVPRQLGVEDPMIIRAGLALGEGDPTRPHMWWIASSETGAYVEADLLADVDGWLAAHPEVRDNIIPAILELSSFEGRVWSLPWMTNNTAMWINVDAFEEAGVPIPSQVPETTWTFQEFVDAVRQLTTDDMKGFLHTVNSPGWDFWTFHAWYAAASRDTAGIPDLDSLEALKVVEMHQDLFQGGYTLTTPTGWDAAPWYAGRVAITANGPWNFPMLSVFDAFEFTVVPYPRDVKPATNLGGNQLFIGKGTPEQEACAFAFGEYMLSDEFQVRFAIQSGNLPITESAAAHPDFQAHLAAHPFLAGFVNQTPYGVARYPIPEYTEISTLFGEAWDRVLLAGADVTETFTTLQTEVEQRLAR